MAAEFDPSKYHDEYQTKLKEMIEAKREGLSAATPEAPRKRAPVIDLMAALQKSLGELPQRKPATKETESELAETAEAPKKTSKRQRVANG